MRVVVGAGTAPAPPARSRSCASAPDAHGSAALGTAAASRRRIFAALAAVAVLPALAGPAAPELPPGPVRLVVAAPAGGPSDALARMLADGMAGALGRPIVVDNRPGGGGRIAAEAVARAA